MEGGDFTPDATDRVILQWIHEDFPLVPHPFREIAERVGIGEEECLARVRRMAEAGVIRKIAPVLEPSKVRRVTVLAAAYAPADQIDELGAAIAAHPRVSHCYERRAGQKETALNLWFTIWAEDESAAKAVLAEIENRTGVAIQSFPQKRRFKIGVTFDIVNACGQEQAS